MPAGCIAQLMHGNRRINKIIGISLFTDGRRFKELVSLKAAAFTVWLAWRNIYRSLQYGKHVRPQNRAHRACPGGIPDGAEACIQPGFVPFRHHARIKLRLIPFFFPQTHAVLIMHIAVKFISAGRRIAHRHGNHRHLVQNIVQIIPAVRTHGDIRRVQAHMAVRIQRILGFLINHALIPPVSQIILRGRPAYIVVKTVGMAAETIVGAIHIYSSVEYIRFAVGDILPGRQIRIKCLFFHFCSLRTLL